MNRTLLIRFIRKKMNEKKTRELRCNDILETINSGGGRKGRENYRSTGTTLRDQVIIAADVAHLRPFGGAVNNTKRLNFGATFSQPLLMAADQNSKNEKKKPTGGCIDDQRPS